MRDVFEDIKQQVPDFKFEVLFDVGANRGDYTRRYVKLFPHATVHAFEPVVTTFWKLQLKADAHKNVRVWNVALGAESGTVRMTNAPGSTGNRVIYDEREGSEDVPVITGREFCKEHGIERISFLKIDAEGYDVEVLKGFDLSICDFVQVETMINRHDPQGAMYADVYNHMVANGFYVFNFYDWAWETKCGPVKHTAIIGTTLMALSNFAPVMRRADTVFIHPKHIDLSGPRTAI